MISHVKFVAIPVADQARALAFYTEKLGFTVTTDVSMGEGQRWIELDIPGAATKLVLSAFDGRPTAPGAPSNVTFATDNVFRTYDELSARGVTFKTPPTEQPWGTYAEFLDSEGNQFVLATPE